MNNAAIAAQSHIDHGAERVAILDIDYHHGNGSQAIFYDRNDVLYVSLHARPEDEYPFLMGYASEIGVGNGKGCNLNIPMPIGTTFEVYRDSLKIALQNIIDYDPDVIVLSLGVDTFADDPVGGFKLQSPDFKTIGNFGSFCEAANMSELVAAGVRATSRHRRLTNWVSTSEMRPIRKRRTLI